MAGVPPEAGLIWPNPEPEVASLHRDYLVEPIVLDRRQHADDRTIVGRLHLGQPGPPLAQQRLDTRIGWLLLTRKRGRGRPFEPRLAGLGSPID